MVNVGLFVSTKLAVETEVRVHRKDQRGSVGHHVPRAIGPVRESKAAGAARGHGVSGIDLQQFTVVIGTHRSPANQYFTISGTFDTYTKATVFCG